MKLVFLVLTSLLFSSLSLAQGRCAQQAERYTPGPGNIEQAQHIETSEEGHLVFEVRVLNNGGTSAYWITTTANCAFVSRHLAWSD